jgi:hypothetical protein
MNGRIIVQAIRNMDRANVPPVIEVPELGVDLVPVDEAVAAQRGEGEQPGGRRAAALHLEAVAERRVMKQGGGDFGEVGGGDG